MAGNLSSYRFYPPEMTFLKFPATPAGTCLVTAYKQSSQNKRGQSVRELFIISEFFLDELPIPLFNRVSFP